MEKFLSLWLSLAFGFGAWKWVVTNKILELQRFPNQSEIFAYYSKSKSFAYAEDGERVGELAWQEN